MFYFNDMPVGILKPEAGEILPGLCAYMPVRSQGHHDLHAALQAGERPRCRTVRGGGTVFFEVVAAPAYGQLLLANVARDPS